MMHHYYVVYHSALGTGSGLIRQVANTENHDLNLAGAHQYFWEKLGFPVIITSWAKLREQRYNEMAAYIRNLRDKISGKPPELKLVEGKGEAPGGSPQPPGALRIVKPSLEEGDSV